MNKVELLIKPASYLCNLDCVYCFYKKTGSIYKTPSVMKPHVLEKLVSSVMEYSGGGNTIFSWQGGEPLLAGIDFYRKAVELQARYGKDGQIVSNSIQTNGLLINEEFIEFFRKYNVLVGVSLDGPEEIHNRYRKYPTGKGTFREVMSKVNLLKKRQIEFNILSTVGEDTAKYPENIYRFFAQSGFQYLQFIPAVDRKGKLRNFSITPETYGDFLCRIFDLWWNGSRPLFSIRFFDNIIELLAGLEPGACSLKKNCGEYLVIEHNGDVYPCDFFVHSEFLVGNIFNDDFKELVCKVKEKFGILKSKGCSECEGCRWNFICNKGCLWLRWINNGRITAEEKDYLCKAYMKFFSHSIDRLKIIADSIV